MGFNSGFKGLREGHRLPMFEYGMSRKIFGPEWEGIEEDWEYCIKKSCLTCAFHQAGLFFRWSNQDVQPVRRMQHARGNYNYMQVFG